MKNYKFILYAMFLLALGNACSNTPAGQVRFYSGLKVPKDVEPLYFEDHWDISGEELVVIIYQFDSVQFEQFMSKNKFHSYESLPLDEQVRKEKNGDGNWFNDDMYHTKFPIYGKDEDPYSHFGGFIRKQWGKGDGYKFALYDCDRRLLIVEGYHD